MFTASNQRYSQRLIHLQLTSGQKERHNFSACHLNVYYRKIYNVFIMRNKRKQNLAFLCYESIKVSKYTVMKGGKAKH